MQATGYKKNHIQNILANAEMPLHKKWINFQVESFSKSDQFDFWTRFCCLLLQVVIRHIDLHDSKFLSRVANQLAHRHDFHCFTFLVTNQLGVTSKNPGKGLWLCCTGHTCQGTGQLNSIKTGSELLHLRKPTQAWQHFCKRSIVESEQFTRPQPDVRIWHVAQEHGAILFDECVALNRCCSQKPGLTGDVKFKKPLVLFN